MDVRELAVPEAEALGHAWLGGLHLLVGIARGDSAARRALEAAGITYGRLQSLGAEIPADVELGKSPQFNPAAANTLARAGRFAADRGEPPTEDDLLAAILWENASLTASLFRRLGVGRGVVLSHLRLLGASTPDGDPPADPEALDWGERIELPIDDLMSVVRALPPRLGEAMVGRLGFNHDGKGHGLIGADRSIDLRRHVEEILGTSPG